MAKGTKADVAVMQLQVPRKKKRRNYKASLSLYMMIAPAIILLFVFNYIPIYGITIAFMKYSPFRGLSGSPWIGLDNFRYFLTDAKYWSVMKNTVILSSMDLAFGFTAPIFFALLANEIVGKKFKRVMQTISYLPHFLSWIVVAGMIRSILSPSTGMINMVMTKVLGMESIYFMTRLDMFRGILVASEIWKGVGWGSILYFSVIAGIDTELYEAAIIDGANRIKQTLYITLPGLLPIIVLLFLLRVAGLFTVGFDRVFNMQNPLVYEVTDVISTYIYRLGLEQAQFSLTTAIGLTQSILAFTLLRSANWLSGKLAGLGLF